jgi:hypothetical protein
MTEKITPTPSETPSRANVRLTGEFDQDQRYRDLFTAVAGRLWSQAGVRLLSVHDEQTLEGCGLCTDENAETIFIEPGNWSQLVTLAAEAGIDISKF